MFLTLILVFIAFLVGMIFGVGDCKKKFGIPKKCLPEDVIIGFKSEGDSDVGHN